MILMREAQRARLHRLGHSVKRVILLFLLGFTGAYGGDVQRQGNQKKWSAEHWREYEGNYKIVEKDDMATASIHLRWFLQGERTILWKCVWIFSVDGFEEPRIEILGGKISEAAFIIDSDARVIEFLLLGKEGSKRGLKYKDRFYLKAE